MSPSLQALGIDRLSVPERLQLMEDLWDNLAESVEMMEIPQSHKDELDRRLAADAVNPQPGLSWDEVKAKLRRRSAKLS